MEYGILTTSELRLSLYVVYELGKTGVFAAHGFDNHAVGVCLGFNLRATNSFMVASGYSFSGVTIPANEHEL